eukprot:8759124-Pyramimonas_sp.AAC.1
MGHHDSHKTKRNHTSAVHLSVHARVEQIFRTHFQSPKNGPESDHVARRATMNLFDNIVMQ